MTSTIRVDNVAPSAGGTSRSLVRFLDNKYTDWYWGIVDRALSEGRRKGQGVYYERHHFVPKFMGGDNSRNNTVLLTAKEHFIAHLLLTKMVEGREKCLAALALSKMTFQTNDIQKRYNAREFSLVRNKVAQAMSELNTGRQGWNKGLTKETNESVRVNAERGSKTKQANPQFFSEETREKISFSSATRQRSPLSQEHKDKISATKVGVARGPHSNETKQKQSGVEYYNPETFETKRIKVHMGEVPPDGWTKGRYLKDKYIWATDGVNNVKCLEHQIPEGYRRGRTLQGVSACL